MFDSASRGIYLTKEMMKKDINALGLDKLVLEIYYQSKVTSFAEAKFSVLGEWLFEKNIANNLEWFMPQLLAYIAKNWQNRLVVENGKIVDFLEPTKIQIPELMSNEDANRYVDSPNFAAQVHQEWMDFIVYQLCKLDRSLFFKVPKGERVNTPQYKSQWNTAVPLVMAGFKMFGSVDYLRWTLAAAKKTSHKALAQFIGSEIPPDLTPEDRLALRQQATKTSAKQERPQWSLNLIGGIKDYARVADYREDKLYLYSIIQTWVMHPTNWTEYMIVDGVNLGKFPEAIAEAQIMKAKSQSADEEVAPWLL
jgi:hypothetical protein